MAWVDGNWRGEMLFVCVQFRGSIMLLRVNERIFVKHYWFYQRKVKLNCFAVWCFTENNQKGSGQEEKQSERKWNVEETQSPDLDNRVNNTRDTVRACVSKKKTVQGLSCVIYTWKFVSSHLRLQLSNSVFASFPRSLRPFFASSTIVYAFTARDSVMLSFPYWIS